MGDFDKLEGDYIGGKEYGRMGVKEGELEGLCVYILKCCEGRIECGGNGYSDMVGVVLCGNKNENERDKGFEGVCVDEMILEGE